MRSRLAVRLLLISVFSASAAPEGGMLADYASVIVEPGARADGRRHLDTPATIEKLHTLHANTYFYLVHSEGDWNDLKDQFLPSAARANIDVWLYFVPPSECPASCSLPFAKDYIQIAAEIAKLSLAYPNLKGLAIDDFADNLTLFTPEYIGRLRQAGREVNAKFQFFPLLYWRSMLPEFLDKYAPVIDGVIFAYRDEPTINTSRNTSLRAQLDATEALLRARGKALVLMVYCAPLGRIPIPPGVEYVRESVDMGLRDMREGKLAGVVTYVLRKTGLPAPAAEDYARAGNGRATILVSGKNIQAGGYGELSGQMSVKPERGPFRLTFWRTALYSRLPPGYFFLQILLDGRMVWEQDIAAFEPKVWKQERADLGEWPDGKRDATLGIRMALHRNAGSITVTIGLDDLAAEGFTLDDPGFENPARWKPAQTAPAFLPMVQMFDPERPIRMFDAVRELYGTAR